MSSSPAFLPSSPLTRISLLPYHSTTQSSHRCSPHQSSAPRSQRPSSTAPVPRASLAPVCPCPAPSPSSSSRWPQRRMRAPLRRAALSPSPSSDALALARARVGLDTTTFPSSSSESAGRGPRRGVLAVDTVSWLYRPPPSACPVPGRGVDGIVEGLWKKCAYLSPVNRNKVETALEIARSGAGGIGGRGGMLLAANVAVAAIVADMQMDVETICAGLLRGLLVEEKAVVDGLGEVVLGVVQGYQKVAAVVASAREIEGRGGGGDGDGRDLYYGIREDVMAVVDDKRAVALELAAAVVQTRQLGKLATVNDRRIVAERAMKLYAPLANRLGIYFIQSELEELAFMHLQPDEFDAISAELAKLTRNFHDVLSLNKAAVDRAVSTAPAVRSAVRSIAVKGRIKGVYSCFRKLKRTGKSLSQLYDLLALRIVVQAKSPDDLAQAEACFAVADAVRDHFCIVPARAKDYVTNPKPNGYRSLHLTVAHPGSAPGRWTPLEIQIRTDRMHRVAEVGTAAHWWYKYENSLL